MKKKIFRAGATSGERRAEAGDNDDNEVEKECIPKSDLNRLENSRELLQRMRGHEIGKG
jgi:hypothetical protein